MKTLGKLQKTIVANNREPHLCIGQVKCPGWLLLEVSTQWQTAYTAVNSMLCSCRHLKPVSTEWGFSQSDSSDILNRMLQTFTPTLVRLAKLGLRTLTKPPQPPVICGLLNMCFALLRVISKLGIAFFHTRKENMLHISPLYTNLHTRKLFPEAEETIWTCG